MSEPARILLADDHAVVRHGLRLVLDAEPDLRVVAEASDGRAAVEQAAATRIDLAILDVSMPGMSGIEAAAELAVDQPSLRTLILSMHGHPSLLHEALRAGASGYVLKSSADRQLVGACRAALRDEPFGYPEGLEASMRGYVGEGGGVRPTLTPRERQVVALVADARTTNQIALQLGISPRTVERHRENILAKLGMRDRVELTRYAIRWGLIEP
jgi:DNA-binding NarL/FixJ family response regulator